MKKIYFITSNKGKTIEAKQKLSSVGIDVIQKNLGYPEIQADSLEEVATYGVECIQKKSDKSFILEDAGLFIDGLGGFPGVYSAYIFYTIGCEGILKLMKGMDDRKATFRSVFAYGQAVSKTKLFVGECKGTIAETMKGDNGFGYDPIFTPENSTKTFAEMTTEEKNKHSHRGKSIDKLLDFFKIQ